MMFMSVFLIKPLFPKHWIQLLSPYKKDFYSVIIVCSNKCFHALLKARVISDQINAPLHTKQFWSKPEGLAGFVEFTFSLWGIVQY